MRLLSDENISYRVIKKLALIYPDCDSSVRLKLIGQSDADVWQKAKQLVYDNVTFDDDYLFLSESRGFPPKVILIRPGSIPTQPLADLLIREHEAIRAFLTSQTEKQGCLELIDFTQL